MFDFFCPVESVHILSLVSPLGRVSWEFFRRVGLGELVFPLLLPVNPLAQTGSFFFCECDCHLPPASSPSPPPLSSRDELVRETTSLSLFLSPFFLMPRDQKNTTFETRGAARRSQGGEASLSLSARWTGQLAGSLHLLPLELRQAAPLGLHGGGGWPSLSPLLRPNQRPPSELAGDGDRICSGRKLSCRNL